MVLLNPPQPTPAASSSSLSDELARESPFHAGELALQERFGVLEHVNSYAPKVVRPFMPDQHREFYASLPFLVVAARDDQGRMWSTLLTDTREGSDKFVKSPTATSLSIQGGTIAGDALDGFLSSGTDLGILGIEFATKRRNRVNGRIVDTSSSDGTLNFRVDQSFGNCPQYITPRKWWTSSTHDNAKESGSRRRKAVVKDRLTESQMETIRQSDTVFVASGYRGEGKDVRYGNDASHRGGASRMD